MLRPVLVALLAVLALSPVAHAHAPATAIGRAVEALGQVPVSYDNGSVVSDVEAGGFPHIVGSNPKVAFMPASASSEVVGGSNAIAAEVAREAGLTGTLVVLVGTELGAWSSDIGADRLAELIAAARTDKSGHRQLLSSSRSSAACRRSPSTRGRRGAGSGRCFWASPLCRWSRSTG